MSSNLKVNTILPSTGTAVGIGTENGSVDVLGHIVGHNTPNISGINSVTASHFYGSGANLTGITQTTINSNTNNYVVTATGTANTLQGESTLTFDGDTLLLKSSTDGRRVSFAGDGTSHYMKYDNTLGGIILNGYGGIAFETNGTNERLRIQSDGTVRFYNSIYGGDNKPIYLGNSNDLSIFHDSGGASIIRYNHSVGGLHFRNNSNADQMVIDSSGSIGQGTGTPRTPDGSNADNPLNGDGTNGTPVFTVYGDSPAINLVSSTTASGDYSLINFGRTGSSSNPYRAVIGYKQSNDILRINAQNAIAFDTGGNINTGERLRIKSDGIIEMGTSIGASSDANIRLRLGRTGDCFLGIRATGNTTSQTGIKFGDSADEDVGVFLYDHYNQRFQINVEGNTRIYIDGAGDIWGQSSNSNIVGFMGAKTTAGTTDWNHSTNARSGNGFTLLLGNHSNGPGGGLYYHPFTFEYAQRDSNGNMTQLAIPYNGGPIYSRYRYSGSWSGWQSH